MRRLLTLALASVLLSVVAHAEPQQVAIPVCRIGQLSAGCLDHLIPTLGDRVFVSDASATDTCASVAAPTGRKYFVLCILTTSGWQPDPDGAVGDGSAISASSTDTLTNKTVLGGDSLANTAPSTNTVRKRSHATDCRTLTVAAAMVKGDECYDADNLMSWVCATPATGGDASYCDATGEWLTTGWNTDTYLTGNGIQLGTNDYIEFHAEASAAGHTRLYLGEEDGYLMLQLPGAPAGPTLYATVATVPSPLPVNECVKFGATGLLEGTGIDCGTMTMHDDQTAAEVPYTPGIDGISLTNVQAVVDALSLAKAAKTEVAAYTHASAAPTSVACTSEGDLYRQTGTDPDVLWVCETPGSPGVWVKLAPAEIGAWYAGTDSTTAWCMKTLPASAVSSGLVDCTGTNLASGEPSANVLLSLPTVVDRIVAHNRLIMTGFNGCTFTLQKVTAAGTVSTVAAVNLPTNYVPLAAKSVTTYALTPTSLAAGDFLRVKAENSDGYCDEGNPCICDEGTGIQLIVTGSR